jgi:hypothetical protein
MIDPPYFISTDPQRVTFPWLVGQSYHLCPVSCRVTESGFDTVPDFVDSFNWEQSSPYSNPSIQVNDLSTVIRTADKSLSDVTFSLDISCTSERSASPDATATTQLQVKFIDECF